MMRLSGHCIRRSLSILQQRLRWARQVLSGGNSNQPKEGRARTAYHEAGHAVAYLAYGLDFDYVSITPERIDGRILNGVVRRLSPVGEIPKLPKEVDLYVSRVISALYAGGISASLFAGESLPSDATKGSDYLKIKNLCEKRDRWRCPLIDGPGGDQYLMERYQETHELIKSHAWLVEAIAQALLSRQKLLYSEVVELYHAWKEEDGGLAEPENITKDGKDCMNGLPSLICEKQP